MISLNPDYAFASSYPQYLTIQVAGSNVCEFECESSTDANEKLQQYAIDIIHDLYKIYNTGYNLPITLDTLQHALTLIDVVGEDNEPIPSLTRKFHRALVTLYNTLP